MTTQGLTYAKAGVSIEAGDKLVHRIGPIAGKTRIPGVIAGVGGFSALFDLQSLGYRHPILVSSTDGVGTKLKIAFMTGIHDTIGIDLVAMGVNDVLTQGAAPLFFLDYFVCGKLDVDIAEAVVRGVAAGAAKRAARSSAVKPRSIRAIFPRANTILRGLSSASWRRRK
jgi:Phosphoribosylaminoimidazole (AIR) synthetase